eukprot:CAMPEP_0172928754 /NCGR_PEP_ID=MMETSP1075-20121228/218137_1 /TAXON_ID=2916 /ORGANISM="Ceratium fusus, Strain PA161109" /LENGTH=45 /DNA_ID= /DNA_START= /DNA_END= /DNA_ORIENTATION=
MASAAGRMQEANFLIKHLRSKRTSFLQVAARAATCALEIARAEKW